MIKDRLDLHERLKTIMGDNGNVYFQPPERMSYPCIRYERQTNHVRRADNRNYTIVIRYIATLITRDPDSDYIEKILEEFNESAHTRHYLADGLYHDTFSIY